MPEYCTQPTVDCRECSLVNYGRDCRNTPVVAIELKARREALGLSQEVMARYIGIERESLARWESGTHSPRDPEEINGKYRELEDAMDQLMGGGRVDDMPPVMRRIAWARRNHQRELEEEQELSDLRGE